VTRVWRPLGNLADAAGHQHGQAAVLVRTRLGVLMHVDEASAVKNGRVAFGNRLQLRHQIGELFHVPPTDVTQYPLTFGAIGTSHFAFGVRIVVVPAGGVAEPGEARNALALGEHV